MAISHLETLKIQGPLPSIVECFHRQQELECPSAWGIAVPAGPRDEYCDLANTRVADLALILAFAFCQQGFKKLARQFESRHSHFTQQNYVRCRTKVDGHLESHRPKRHCGTDGCLKHGRRFEKIGGHAVQQLM